MSTFFNTVHITNFKSLKDVTLSDCKRINLLIGKPNVGKSNILEAIGLFSLLYFKYNQSKKITQFIRLEDFSELFFDGNLNNEITINADDDCCAIKFSVNNSVLKEDCVIFSLDTKDGFVQQMTEDGKHEPYNISYSILLDRKLNLRFNKLDTFYKKPSVQKTKFYKFPHSFLSKNKSIRHSYLIPPIGVNLLEAIQESKIDKELAKIFSEYGLKLLFDKTNNTLRIMKALKEDNAMISFPFSSIADTLQRVIFFKTAIASNKNSIILFEEPEAHCFPPYIRHITQEIIDSETNQFFIATHSPYVLNDFLEYERDDVAIFMADFKDGQTVIKRLTDSEVNDVYEYGIDLFFNSELFTDEI